MQELLDRIIRAIDWANRLLWGGIAGEWWLGVLIIALLPIGLYFSIRSRFIQFRHFGHMTMVMVRGIHKDHPGSISAFQAFATSAAARIGTGSLAGVAVAITAGGPGSVFWMWMVAWLGMATSMVENTLAQVYKEKGEQPGTFRGGPAYYINKGLGPNWKWLSVSFSIFLLLCYGFIFNSIQSNTMATALNDAWEINPMLVGVVVAVTAAIIVFGGIRSIARFAGVVVPFMAIAYLTVAMVVLLINLGDLPKILGTILKNAFGLEQAGAGALGAVVSNGIKRGLFANEAGLGSSPNVGAAADVKHPLVQGYVQMASVFLDTIVICTCTAAIILVADVYMVGNVEGVKLAQDSLASEVGSWGTGFVAFALLFFAFTSIIGNYYYGETNIFYLYHTPVSIFCYRIIFLLFILFGAWVSYSGSTENFTLLWRMADVAMGFMASTNILAITLLSGVAFKVLGDYEAQLNRGVKEPIFDARKCDIKGIDHEVWDRD
ncbi:alanine/glycine:cation symporter family protein [Microbulbifer sp. CnH-101-G]|uniref:alanine/glycine:cation symporter family protein n=1 Tax=Microbulbifer sp. CnH-101-G TaxID=3243393 RepID=UPI00403A0D34